MEPRTGVDFEQLCQVEFCRLASPRSKALNASVVKNDQLLVAGQAHVEFDDIHAKFNGSQESCPGVLWIPAAGTTMCRYGDT
jgi:hypothetical protein